MPGKRIRNVHLKEYSKKSTDHSLEAFRPLLDGTTNWPAVMQAFSDGLRGIRRFEYFHPHLHHPEAPIHRLPDSLDRLRARNNRIDQHVQQVIPIVGPQHSPGIGCGAIRPVASVSTGRFAAGAASRRIQEQCLPSAPLLAVFRLVPDRIHRRVLGRLPEVKACSKGEPRELRLRLRWRRICMASVVRKWTGIASPENASSTKTSNC